MGRIYSRFGFKWNTPIRLEGELGVYLQVKSFGRAHSGGNDQLRTGLRLDPAAQRLPHPHRIPGAEIGQPLHLARLEQQHDG